MRVKVCGITNKEDALLAIELGAWALGFNFYLQSPRYLLPEKAATIIDAIATPLEYIGIFVDSTPEEIKQIQQQVPLTRIQLYLTQPHLFEKYRRLFPQTLIPVLQPDQHQTLEMVEDFANDELILIDAPRTATLVGGTGNAANWSLAENLSRKTHLILAGGLHIDNVCAAVDLVRPFAIDVCSHLESAPGKKDPQKMQQFFKKLDEVNYVSSS